MGICKMLWNLRETDGAADPGLGECLRAHTLNGSLFSDDTIDYQTVVADPPQLQAPEERHGQKLTLCQLCRLYSCKCDHLMRKTEAGEGPEAPKGATDPGPGLGIKTITVDECLQVQTQNGSSPVAGTWWPSGLPPDPGEGRLFERGDSLTDEGSSPESDREDGERGAQSGALETATGAADPGLGECPRAHTLNGSRYTADSDGLRSMDNFLGILLQHP